MIGHEGAGSLLSLLKEKNWVNHLEAGSHVPARGFGTFKIAVDLTTDGLKNTDEIINHMFEVSNTVEHINQLAVFFARPFIFIPFSFSICKCFGKLDHNNGFGRR